MLARLHERVITLDDGVNDEGDLVYYNFYEYIKPINVIEALKDLKWIQAMMEQLKSIEVNKTWSIEGKKAIDVKWDYKLKLNPKGEVIRHKLRLVSKGFLQR